jgi:hypothetical protein
MPTVKVIEDLIFNITYGQDGVELGKDGLPTAPLGALPLGGFADAHYGAIPGAIPSINTINTNNTMATQGVSITGGGTYTTTYPNNIWTTNTTASPSYTFSNSVPSNKISIQGEDADLEINGKSMKAWMERVEQQLNILTPDPELEAEWNELKRLGDRYRKLEKKCREKADMWEKLKSMPKVDT